MRKEAQTEKEFSLKGKTVAVTGSAGGLGSALCRHILSMEGKLILMDRNPEKSKEREEMLKKEFPRAQIGRIPLELEDISSVRQACEQLKKQEPDIFIQNAGAYHLPKGSTSLGFDRVFQINFLSPYYMARQLMPLLKSRNGKMIVIGSIAHAFARGDMSGQRYRLPAVIYGNSKRCLMFSLTELAKKNPEARFCIAHPGITYTNITSHYPKITQKIIRRPMQLLFISPEKAALGAVRGMFEEIPLYHWIGPRVLNIWGKPTVKRFSSDEGESQQIFSEAERLYQEMERL